MNLCIFLPKQRNVDLSKCQSAFLCFDFRQQTLYLIGLKLGGCEAEDQRKGRLAFCFSGFWIKLFYHRPRNQLLIKTKKTECAI